VTKEMPLEEALRIAKKGAADHKDVPSVSRTLLAYLHQLETDNERLRDMVARYADIAASEQGRIRLVSDAITLTEARE